MTSHRRKWIFLLALVILPIPSVKATKVISTFCMYMYTLEQWLAEWYNNVIDANGQSLMAKLIY